MSKTILAQQEHPLTADTKLVVSHGTWRKHDYVDVRVHWRSPGNEWFPTKKGVRLDVVRALAVTDGLYQILHGTLPAAPTNGQKPHRNGRKRDNTGLPGPTPPRNSAGGFKVVGLGRIGEAQGYAAGKALFGKDACDPYDFKPAVFIPPWVKYVVNLASGLRAA